MADGNGSVDGAPEPGISNTLLARMAASIAAGIEANPSCDDFEVNEVAERAVSVARAIVVRIQSGEA